MSAQYMRMTTDNPADNTRLQPGVTNIVTITLDTNHDRNGSVQTCNSHTAANCGAPTVSQPLSMFSYTLAYRVLSGTVSWGTFTPADAAYTPTAPQIQNATEVEINMARPLGTVTDPGLSTLGTIPVTIVSGAPSIQLQIGPGTLNPFGFGTGFGAFCDGYFFPNTYVAGDPSDPCGVSNGFAGDWFDFDGVAAPGNLLPVLVAPATASATEGQPMSAINANATDPDAANTLTITQSGKPASLTFTADTPGPSPRTASISGTPALTSAGTYNIVWTVTDGSGGSANTTTALTIANANGPSQPPVLDNIPTPITQGGCSPPSTSRGISATDPDGDVITFTWTGPPWMSVRSNNQIGTTRTALLLLDPPTANGMFAGSVTATAGGQSNTKFFTIQANMAFERPVISPPPADMSLAYGHGLDQTLTATMPCPQQISFVKVSGPAFMFVTTPNPSSGTSTGIIHLQPSASDVGTYSAEVMSIAGASEVSDHRFLTITVRPLSPPTLNPIANMAATEGMTADQGISATNPDGDAVTFSKTSGPTFMTVSTTDPGHGTGSATGNIHLAPGPGDPGTYFGEVTVTNGILSDSQSLIILALPGNRCPTANAGGPYSGLAGIPVSFDGSASSDPDGNPLTYAWDFDASDGIQVDATGVAANHAYATAGTFAVTLSVSDNTCGASATTTASIQAACGATVFNGYDTIRLNSGKPTWFGYVQPTSGCYTNSDVVIASFVMKYGGQQITASGKTGVGGDKSGDGIPEIKISFSKSDLRTLFAGLPNGHTLATVTLEAHLGNGGTLSGTTQVDVVNSGSFSVATVSPNPLNPDAILTYSTSKPGFVRIDLFNIQGRLVRRLVDESALAAGIHDVTIDGRGARGEKLPSGVYYIRGTSAEGEFKQLITILK